MRVLVTGASRGIGRAIALTLAGDHDVAVGYRTAADAAADVVDEVREQGSNTVAVGADVRDSAAVESMISEVVDEFGGLDAVVNNAGIVEPDLATDIDDDQWSRVLETNLTGAFYVTRAAIPHLEPDGDVVFVSSIGGTGGTVDASYAASKAALHGLTRSLAREYGDSGLQVNAVAPGPVDTEMNDTILEFLERVEFRGHGNLDTHLPEYACQPDAVAHTVAYLLENEYVQGEIVNVNGGMQFQ
ncbi:SDR family NAD(P)-dependent oxidoreductase [Natrarchaeobaculum sulfurireducens]|uniref:Short-chain alcohol dehydrogenase n=1 Tax=Natrarchaeobaculum sulfurireducens TaxID=2044521 RepID=A0A346PHR6_9EURY|nr:SDR family oxidoreductase [Natrarchaeobaculum sulfurireducens]AXR79061.1 Short-chain alcohol dehydrogenase [Natrarchaeobaculum sulfurireducens]